MVKWSQTGEGCRRMNLTAVTWSMSHSICWDKDEEGAVTTRAGAALKQFWVLSPKKKKPPQMERA